MKSSPKVQKLKIDREGRDKIYISEKLIGGFIF